MCQALSQAQQDVPAGVCSVYSSSSWDAGMPSRPSRPSVTLGLLMAAGGAAETVLPAGHTILTNRNGCCVSRCFLLSAGVTSAEPCTGWKAPSSERPCGQHSVLRKALRPGCSAPVFSLHLLGLTSLPGLAWPPSLQPLGHADKTQRPPLTGRACGLRRPSLRGRWSRTRGRAQARGSSRCESANRACWLSMTYRWLT